MTEARVRHLERQVAQLQKHLAESSAQNERLAATLKNAKERLVTLREDLDRASTPPLTFGVMLRRQDPPPHPDGAVEAPLYDVLAQGRKVRVAAHGEIPSADLVAGREVLLNESQSIVGVGSFEQIGDIVTVKEPLDPDRVLVLLRGEDERVCRISGALTSVPIRAGDSLLMDSRNGFVYERIAQPEVSELVLEEVPDITYADIGGLGSQIEQIQDAVELPFLHPDLYSEHRLSPPKGVLLYGPPGCGKTLIAKAVAASLARKVAQRTGRSKPQSFFLNIKGPELLNKYVGETERHIRLIFQRAREKSKDGTPVVVFFDEMESLFRTRGSGVSSDVETTIVPQLLAEIDGVERLDNVVVIGASNREDMIDPAILRPGRLDVKIKIERPDAESARDIFTKYLTDDVPLHADDLHAHSGDRAATLEAMIAASVERMYAPIEENKFLEVTYAGGDKETLYFKDFNSGAMINNIVDRAKKRAIKDLLINNSHGLRVEHLLAACVDEFKENEDLPNTTNPDDWARISGKKGERIVYIRTLVAGKDGVEPGRTLDRGTPGQYL
ncbi:MAG: proteasome ATPase [Ornithinimicrobium sp.]